MAANPIRLRQVALASRDLDGVTARLHDAFGLNVAFRDPGIIHYGLRNAVLPAGESFIEVVEPIRADASAGRFLDRRGGDAGYMVILQVADAAAARDHAVAQGARVVDTIDRSDYLAFHFHPADFGGVLVSFDQQKTVADPLEPFGDWFPAGKEWREHRSEAVAEVTRITLAGADPDALAARWSGLLDRPVAGRTILLHKGRIVFEPGEGRTSLAAIGLRARASGPTAEAQVIGGVRFLSESS